MMEVENRDEKTPFRLRRLRVVQLLTYVAVRVLIAVVSMFPFRLVRRIGRLLGRLMYLFDFKHRKLAHKNLTRTVGWPKDRREQARFIRRVYEHVGISIVENLMLPKLVLGRRLLERTSFDDRHVIDRVLAQGRGAIVVIAHLGNWEWGGLAVSMAGLPLNSLARPIENPLVDRYVNRFRTLTGQKIILKDGALRAMVDVLRRNEMLVVQADLDARHSGLFVPFFGQPASTVKSPALLCLRQGAPIVPVNVWRDEAGVHHVKFTEPLSVGRTSSIDEGVLALTTAMNARLEEFVREHPTQWMWLHGRWKTAGRVLARQADLARRAREAEEEEVASAE